MARRGPKRKLLTGAQARRRRRRVHLVVVESDVERPRTRGDCADVQRPCPWVSCRHHLLLEVNPATGSIRVNRGRAKNPDPTELPAGESCALDVASEARSHEEVARLLGVSTAYVKELAKTALARCVLPLIEAWQ